MLFFTKNVKIVLNPSPSKMTRHPTIPRESLYKIPDEGLHIIIIYKIW